MQEEVIRYENIGMTFDNNKIKSFSEENQESENPPYSKCSLDSKNSIKKSCGQKSSRKKQNLTILL